MSSYFLSKAFNWPNSLVAALLFTGNRVWSGLRLVTRCDILVFIFVTQCTDLEREKKFFSWVTLKYCVWVLFNTVIAYLSFFWVNVLLFSSCCHSSQINFLFISVGKRFARVKIVKIQIYHYYRNGNNNNTKKKKNRNKVVEKVLREILLLTKAN